jgi:serine/threonine-protein kinase
VTETGIHGDHDEVPGASTLSGAMLDGRYQILRRIGEGGMAYVYEARDREDGQVVALKVLTPAISQEPVAAQRLRREAGLAVRLTHPHTCPILRIGETPTGRVYLVMPFLRGELLADRLDRTGPIALEPGVEFLVQVCAGLHHAHQLNIIHRDVKPENVMLVPDEGGREHAVLMDFGLAKDIRPPAESLELTGTGMIPGTPEFMSPEQVRGLQVDARSDVYALGVLGYEMFTGALPFRGKNTHEVMVNRLAQRPVPVRFARPGLPNQLEVVLLKALAHDPGDRYQTALELGRALANVLDESGARRLDALLQ